MTKIFLFAHQDDEFGVYHEIEKLVAAKENIEIIYLTNGEYGKATSKERNQESIRVLKKLGVSEQQIFFLGEQHSIGDQKLHLNLETAYNALLSHLQTIGNIDTIYSLAWEGGHPDHDACFILANAISKKLGNAIILQFSLYNSYNSKFLPFSIINPIIGNGTLNKNKIPADKWLKHFYYFCSYPSQKKTWLVLLPFFIWHYISGKGQVLQETPPELFKQRPHNGKLLYEKRNWLTWENFQKATSDFIEHNL